MIQTTLRWVRGWWRSLLSPPGIIESSFQLKYYVRTVVVTHNKTLIESCVGEVLPDNGTSVRLYY